jgi:hypothetical protein
MRDAQAPVEMVDLDMDDSDAPPVAEPQPFIVGVDLGQAQDYTAIAVVEEVRTGTLDERNRAHVERLLHLRYLERIPLGTRYPAVIRHVLGLLDSSPLSREVPLVVDKTGVGSAVVDMFTAAGVQPIAVTITGGNEVIREAHHAKVPKRELVSALVALYHGGRLKVAEGLPLVPKLVDELLNFRIKVNLKSGHDSYEAWRESVHDDLVLAVALACWHAENRPAPVEPLDPTVVGWMQKWHR